MIDFILIASSILFRYLHQSVESTGAPPTVLHSCVFVFVFLGACSLPITALLPTDTAVLHCGCPLRLCGQCAVGRRCRAVKVHRRPRGAVGARHRSRQCMLKYFHSIIVYLLHSAKCMYGRIPETLQDKQSTVIPSE